MRSIITVLFLSTTLYAQQWTTPVRVNNDPAGKAQRAPVIHSAVDGRIFISWIDHRVNKDGDIYLAVSTDGGKTFGANKPVYTGGSVNSNYQRRANFAIDSHGWLHVIWLENKINSQPDIFYSRSKDGGDSFSPPVSISGDSSKWAQDFPSIALDARDNIYICFLNSVEVQQKLSTNVQIYFTASTDGGDTFSVPRRISHMPGYIGGSCECCTTDITAAGNGHVFVAFRSNINNRRDIFITRSFDGGSTFETAIPVPSEQWIVPACPVTGPSIIVDRDETAHVVWRDTRPSAGGMDRAYYATLGMFDSAATMDTRISDTQNWSNYPEIVITNDGIMLIAYEDGRGNESAIRYTYSNDGGNSFAAGRKLTASPPSVKEIFVSLDAGADGSRYFVWQDAARDEGDILFMQDTETHTPIAPTAVLLQAPADGSVLVKRVTFRWNKPSNLGRARYVSYDLVLTSTVGTLSFTGLRDTSFTTDLSDGVYGWSVTARTLTGGAISETRSLTVSTSTFAAPAYSVSEFSMEFPFPHPLAPATVSLLRFHLAQSGGIFLHLTDILGRRLRTLAHGFFEAGDHAIEILPEGIAPGIYFCTLQTGSMKMFRRVVVSP